MPKVNAIISHLVIDNHLKDQFEKFILNPKDFGADSNMVAILKGIHPSHIIGVFKIFEDYVKRFLSEHLKEIVEIEGKLAHHMKNTWEHIAPKIHTALAKAAEIVENFVELVPIVEEKAAEEIVEPAPIVEDKAAEEIVEPVPILEVKAAEEIVELNKTEEGVVIKLDSSNNPDLADLLHPDSIREETSADLDLELAGNTDTDLSA